MEYVGIHFAREEVHTTLVKIFLALTRPEVLEGRALCWAVGYEQEGQITPDRYGTRR